MDTDSLHQASWMADLPRHLTRTPLCSLAIPGSHDSGSFCLHTDEGVAVDQSKAIRTLMSSCCGLGRSVIHKWSQTQSLDFTQQLEAGVRYLDLRICCKPRTRDVHFVHGLYGQKMVDGCAEINRFLDVHKKEIVILDFNHFYNMTAGDHAETLLKLRQIFDSKLMEYTLNTSPWKLTMENLWRTPHRLIMFYHNPIWSSVSFAWPDHLIQSPWPNLTSVQSLCDFLEKSYFGHTRYGNGEFYVWQGVLTPSGSTIAGSLFSSLKNKFAEKAMGGFLSWVKDKTPSHVGINICIADFVELEDFSREIILLNNQVRYREVRT